MIKNIITQKKQSHFNKVLLKVFGLLFTIVIGLVDQVKVVSAYSGAVTYPNVSITTVSNNSVGNTVAVSPRKVVLFNYNWEFLSLPGISRQLDKKYLLPNRGWKIISVSSQEIKGEYAPARNCIDGHSDTFWHSRWQGNAPNYPHNLVIDLGKRYKLDGFTYLSRQDGNINGRIDKFALYVSIDGKNWAKPVITGHFRNTDKLQVVGFHRPVAGRYIKLVALSGINNNRYAAIAELGFIKAGTKFAGSNWQDQFSIVHIDTSKKQSKEGIKNSSKAMCRQLTGNNVPRLDKLMASLKDRKWQIVTLPHTAHIEPLVVNNQWQGICYYHKNFYISPAYSGKKLFVKFEGAMQLARVWVNGKYKCEHAGGYTPFTIDITDNVKYGADNTITVQLDNRDNPEIPPGKPLASLDFCYYSGIYRDVELITTSKVYITDAVAANLEANGGVFVRYGNVSSNMAVVNVRTHIRNDNAKMVSCVVKQQLFDKQGRCVNTVQSNPVFVMPHSNHTFNQQFVVHNPRLWSIDNPYLYTLRSSILPYPNGNTDAAQADSNIVATTASSVQQNKAGTLIYDTVQTRIGIRSIEFTRARGFLLNGKPIKIMGTNRHQEYPYIGNALSDNAQYRDMYKIKKAGFNFVRLSHYPQAPAALAACDELGLLVVEPIPGWQFFNSSPVFVNRVYRDIRDMIRRDRNHPCVVLWEVVLNESHAPKYVEQKAYEIAHTEYPAQQCFACGDPYDARCWDVCYNQWLKNITRPQNAEPYRPGFIREYGDYEFGGGNSTSRVFRQDGEKALLGQAWNYQWSHNRYAKQYPWTAGDAAWCMYDYNRGCSRGIAGCGCCDIFRLPKFTYYFYKSQSLPYDTGFVMASGPMVYIANYWTNRPSPCKVVVYSNCQQVELKLNGKTIAIRTPDNGPDTDYGPRYTGGNPFDGGNCRHLQHPPFTFTNIKYQPGTLTAIGYINNKPVARYTVKTPGHPAKLDIKVDTSGRPLCADGADVVFAYVRICDNNGTLIPDAADDITLTVKGAAHIVGPTTTTARAGIATFLLQADTKPGNITITAQASNLSPTTATIVTNFRTSGTP